MKNLFFTFIIGLFTVSKASAQYKFDNTAYKTVYINDLCNELRKSSNALLLDVRSAGEYSDTSVYTGLNIGHLKGAVNINVRELGKRLGELKDYKNQPVYVYCSHSQRSRVSSKMLADSGFTNVVNVNGGMTEMNLLRNSADPCLQDLYATNNHFKILSTGDVVHLLSNRRDISIIDVRADSAYKSISKIAKLNAFGHIRGSINIPSSKISESLSKIPQNKPVLLVDNYGDESIKIAKLLSEQGYTDVSVLFNGLDNWVSEKTMPEKEKLWIHSKDYGFITAEEFDYSMAHNPPALLLDVRTRDEFTNREKTKTYLNRGHIQNAVNTPLGELNAKLTEMAAYKDKSIVVYAFSNNPEAFEAAKFLADNGFEKVKVLTGGLWNVRWKAANIKGLAHLMKWVVDVPSDNL
ncbi:rhodanese-like domain-containing protein [Emticicia sp. BO119]|uniref:rhodanese-like domain-containing protein n=1 Tax=Emticicia sp. BO119 TaxID=2757768 RepID=UPI0015F02DDE|nr:rhodanese-like domain-containing protein [Emticicia sp. BO119]MBA4850891.1 rhodanese-like domain-containing protein [Emticicia sp. BO119]